jgi:hypothetical protein
MRPIAHSERIVSPWGKARVFLECVADDVFSGKEALHRGSGGAGWVKEIELEAVKVIADFARANAS